MFADLIFMNNALCIKDFLCNGLHLVVCVCLNNTLVQKFKCVLCESCTTLKEYTTQETESSMQIKDALYAKDIHYSVDISSVLDMARQLEEKTGKLDSQKVNSGGFITPHKIHSVHL